MRATFSLARDLFSRRQQGTDMFERVYMYVHVRAEVSEQVGFRSTRNVAEIGASFNVLFLNGNLLI